MSSELVVGYDGSETADAALRAALALGRELGAKIVVAFGYFPNPVGGEVLDYAKALEEHGRTVLAQAQERARDEGVELEPVLVEEKPAQGLVDLARERDARAIIIGTHGEGPIRGALIGSTAHKLIHLADRPVLVVPR